jgi:C4-dicarboxylate transporter DctM subunit
MSGVIIFGLLFALLLTGMPISIALGLTVLAFLALVSSLSLDTISIVSQKLFTGLDNFAIMAIPFFVLSGTFLATGGAARRIIHFATTLVGWMHGGLAMAAVLSCAFFAAISGSSPATVVAIGSIMLPAMLQRGYTKKFSVGVIATSGGLGILIPPSIVLVIYGVSTSESIGRLFIAGIVPGIIMALALLVVTYIVARIHKFPTLPRASLREVWQAFRDAAWGLALVVVVIGGIYGGLFTPTEAAAVSAVYALIVALFVYKELSWKQVPKALLDAANMSAMLLYIITNAILFSFLLTTENIPQELGAVDHRAGTQSVDVPAVREHPAVLRRRFHGAFVDHPDSRAAVPPGGIAARHRPDSPRDHHDHQHGAGDDYAAGGAESLRGERVGEDGVDRGNESRRAMDTGGDGGLAVGDLRAGDCVVAAELALRRA